MTFISRSKFIGHNGQKHRTHWSKSSDISTSIMKQHDSELLENSLRHDNVKDPFLFNINDTLFVNSSSVNLSILIILRKNPNLQTVGDC